MTATDHDSLVRARAFEFLSELTTQFGDVLRIESLRRGFQYLDQRVPLMGPQGIFKPRVLELPLSITTSPNSPYDDVFSGDDLLRYRYRGKDPDHPDNVRLRAAMSERKPLIYFHGIIPGRYVADWPAYVIVDHPRELSVTVAMDDRASVFEALQQDEVKAGAEARRRYITAAVRVRLHQRAFRERVLAAYREQCALCRLRHSELLEAAHITPDAEEAGEPRIDNGVSLCKLHHAAFDRNILGIRPDYVVEIRQDILEEVDGPMLRSGLQEMHGSKILVPHRAEWRPNSEALERRYELFREAR